MNKELPPVIDRDSILKLVDYLLLNAYSTESSGLYHGKMGLSVCLFELARHFEKEAWEEHAFELLLQAVAGADNDVSFEKGLSGIGYALFYLQSNAFIEIDMDEIWGEKSQKIESHFRSSTLKKHTVKWSLIMHYFLFLISDPVLKSTLLTYINHLFDRFALSFEAIANSSNNIVKMNVENDFNAFLKFTHCMNIKTKILHESEKIFVLCQLYSNLHQSKMIPCNFETEYYINLLADQYNDQKLKSYSTLQCQKSLLSTYSSVMTLKQKLDRLFLLLKNRDGNREHIIKIEDSIFRKKNMTLEQSIYTNLGTNLTHYSYYSGIARLLLYLVYRSQLFDNKSISRFDYLFI